MLGKLAVEVVLVKKRQEILRRISQPVPSMIVTGLDGGDTARPKFHHINSVEDFYRARPREVWDHNNFTVRYHQATRSGTIPTVAI